MEKLEGNRKQTFHKSQSVRRLLFWFSTSLRNQLEKGNNINIEWISPMEDEDGTTLVRITPQMDGRPMREILIRQTNTKTQIAGSPPCLFF